MGWLVNRTQADICCAMLCCFCFHFVGNLYNNALVLTGTSTADIFWQPHFHVDTLKHMKCGFVTIST